MDNTTLFTLAREAYTDAQTAGLPCTPWEKLRFLFNQNLGRNWGCCRKEIGGYAISLSERLCQNTNSNAILNTLIHELIHAAGVRGHRADFRFWARKINARFPDKYNVSRCTSIKEKMTLEQAMAAYKYIIQCPKCGMIYGLQRFTGAVRKPETYWCGVCERERHEKIYLKRIK